MPSGDGAMLVCGSGLGIQTTSERYIMSEPVDIKFLSRNVLVTNECNLCDRSCVGVGSSWLLRPCCKVGNGEL